MDGNFPSMFRILTKPRTTYIMYNRPPQSQISVKQVFKVINMFCNYANGVHHETSGAATWVFHSTHMQCTYHELGCGYISFSPFLRIGNKSLAVKKT